MGDLKSNTYGYLNLAWSICSLLVCALYNPYQSCKYCRNGKPPGNVMLPFSFGVALLSQHVISLSLAKFPFLPCLVVQIFLGLAVQNYSTFIWIQADEYVLKELSKICRTEEEILLYWWYIMVTAGLVVSLVSFTISTCSKGHIYFKNGLQIKPWTWSPGLNPMKNEQGRFSRDKVLEFKPGRYISRFHTELKFPVLPPRPQDRNSVH